MVYTKLLSSKSVLLHLEAGSADDVLESLVDLLIQADPDLASRRSELVGALEEREKQGSTASGRIAIPHVKLPGWEKISMAVAIHPQGVEFHALDGEPVHVFFVVARPEEGAEEHLGLLRWIAGIAHHPDFVSFALQAETPAQIVDLLSELSPV